MRIASVLNLITGANQIPNTMRMPKHRTRRPVTERELLTQESAIGAAIFGPIENGHERSFFCLDAATWIWYEQWQDAADITRSMTTRYEVHPEGILKVQEGARYHYLEGQELENLLAATDAYYKAVTKDIYHALPLRNYAA